MPDAAPLTPEDRGRGALLGLAVGDALGTTLELKRPGTFEPISDMVGGGPFNLQPGEWTDDTSMALCLAESVLESGGFDPADQMRRYLRWYREGHFSVRGRCFDIGSTVRQSLHWFESTGDAIAGLTDEKFAGNDSLVRVAPVPIAWSHDPAEAIRLAGESSRTTHDSDASVVACRYLAGLIAGAIHGASKSELLAPRYTPSPGSWTRERLSHEISEVAAGSFLEKSTPLIRGGGWVVQTIEAALWAFANSSSFREGALLAVNLGDDAAATGAVYGQLAGAHYGASGIPEEWLGKLAMRAEITDMADRLTALQPNP